MKINRFYSKNVKKIMRINNKSMVSKAYDPVTNFDKSIEKFIRKNIIKKFPDHNVIGEEYDDINKESNFKWVVDPIDGTRALLGAPTWSNLIGLNFLNKLKLGLANFPN